MSRKTFGRRKERGLTLIEVLVAFFILFVVTLAVLQLLSMAYLVNLGSMVRTELTYKAEQVVETIRLLNFRYYWLDQLPTATESTCCPISPTPPDSPFTISMTGPCLDFWGPNGANVLIYDPNSGTDISRFALDYQIDANLAVTVHVVPKTSGPNVYLGPTANKVVVYVAQMRNF
ncbi:MAG: prepilin-type N-terminal cleavage/methylation domain-containing protein [Thermoanaerobaculaceae bacterium]